MKPKYPSVHYLLFSSQVQMVMQMALWKTGDGVHPEYRVDKNKNTTREGGTHISPSHGWS